MLAGKRTTHAGMVMKYSRPRQGWIYTGKQRFCLFGAPNTYHIAHSGTGYDTRILSDTATRIGRGIG